jgi:dihydrofolate synthase/folylpolyglutamate synthase
MTEYQRTIDWLYTLEAAKGMDFKLERVALALERLGAPQRRFASLHVAGTNGKGSVAAMLHAVLGAAGYRVGLYTSPHLVDLTERIRIGPDAIAPGAVVALTAEIRAAANARGIDLTFFEFLTVMAFVHFARAGVAVAVIEVGLGGRLDATNVVDPLAAVITTIGFDHMQWLGDTLPAIAAEKGGIIKPGRPVVLGRVDAEVAALLRALAAERGAPALQAERDFRTAALPPGGSGEGARFDFEGVGWRLRDLPLPLRGAHQLDNAGTALAALAAVRERFPVSDDALRRGLAAVRWPGRLDVVGHAPLVILDGAHNADGIAALTRELPRLLGDRRLHLLFAVMADKDWQPMVARLAPFCASAVVTEVLPPRGAPAALVARAFEPHCPVRAEADVAAAWHRVVATAHREDAILAAGSLFLVGALYATVLRTALRPDDTARALHP